MFNFLQRQNKPDITEQEYGGFIADKILGAFNLTQEHVDKIKSVIDKIDIKEVDGQTEITINLKKVVIRIEK